MFSLVIETSTERACALFFDERKTIFQSYFPFGLNNSKYLLPEIERGFKELGKSPQELDFIAVGVGPGSYTGVRVGVMTAKTFAFALNKPLVTFFSLEAYSCTQKLPYAVILDAKIGGAYLWKETEIQPQLVPLKDLELALAGIQVLVSPNATQIKKKMDELYPNNHWKWEEKGPDEHLLSQLTTEKWSQGNFSDPSQVKPLYLRKTQAEIEKEK